MLVFEITLKINGFEITPLISNPNPNSNPSSQTQPIGFPLLDLTAHSFGILFKDFLVGFWCEPEKSSYCPSMVAQMISHD